MWQRRVELNIVGPFQRQYQNGEGKFELKLESVLKEQGGAAAARFHDFEGFPNKTLASPTTRRALFIFIRTL